MNNLLIFFALPIATIIFSIALQKILKNPVLVAAVIFAIFLIVTFTAFDETFLVAALVYTILSYITAYLTQLFCRCIRNCLCNTPETNNCNTCELIQNRNLDKKYTTTLLESNSYNNQLSNTQNPYYMNAESLIDANYPSEKDTLNNYERNNENNYRGYCPRRNQYKQYK